MYMLRIGETAVDSLNAESSIFTQNVWHFKLHSESLTRACFKNASAAQIAPGLKPEDGWEEAIFAGSKEPRSTD